MRREALRTIIAIGVVLAWSVAPLQAIAAEAAPPLVFAAASLKTAFDELFAAWEKETGTRVSVSYAASSGLAKQIEEGAPADLFVSADTDWMDYLQERKLIQVETRRVLVGNTLVLIAPADSAGSFTIAKGADLGGFLGEGRLAIGEVASVPAGKYAKQALQALAMWDGVAAKLAPTTNVRAALALVARGEAAAGIVYLSDAKSEPKVRVLGVFPPESHAPIIYPIALTTASDNPEAPALLAYLLTPAAGEVYRANGFTLPQ